MADVAPENQPRVEALPGTPPGWYPDPASGRHRWWDGQKWTENFHTPPVVVLARNGAATASLVLGIIGFFFMDVPFFVGWFLGGTPDLLAVIFGVIGLNNASARLGVGRGAAIVGLVLGSLSILSAFVGAGSIW